MDRLNGWIDAIRAATKNGDPVRPDPCVMPELIGFLEELRTARQRYDDAIGCLQETAQQLTAAQDELRAARGELAELRTQLRTVTAEFNGAISAVERLQQELAERRDLAAGSYSVGWTWRDGELVPDEYVLTDEDGDPVDLEVDASGLVRAALERQARIWVRAAEMTPAVLLEQLLAMVGPGWDLVADSDSERGRRPQYHAGWFRGGAATGRPLEEHHGEGANCAAAIRTATIALLRGRQQRGTCAHWGSPGDEDGDRECLATKLRLRKTAESSCGESWQPAQWLEPEPGDGEGG